MEDSQDAQLLRANFTKWLHDYLRNFRGWSLMAIVLVLPEVVLLLITPLPLKWLTDFFATRSTTIAFLGKVDKNIFLFITLGSVILIPAISSLYTILSNRIQLSISNKLSRGVIRQQVGHTLLTNDAFSRKNSTGEILYSLNNQATQVVDLALVDYVSLARSLLIVLGVIGVIYVTIGPLTLLLVVPLLFFACSYVYFGSQIEVGRLHVEKLSSKYQKTLHDVIQNKKSVQLFLRFDLTNRVLDRLKDQHNANVALSTTYLLLSSANEIVIALSVAFVTLVAIFSPNGTVTAGSIVLIINYMYYFFDPLGDAIEALGSMRSRKIALFENYCLLACNDDVFKQNPSKVEIGNWLEPISLSNITIHSHGEELFTDLSLSIPTRSITVIVGKSGVGKSTIFDLILGRRTPLTGAITHGSHSISDYDIYDWWQGIAVSAQDLNFLTDTVDEIVSFGEPARELKLPDIESAIAFSASRDFLHQLTQDDPSKEISSTEVSEGQKQRISLAQAIYTKRPIMLLDEPISALDDESKQKVIHNIGLFKNSRTIVIISHDPAILAIADVIYHLKSGGEAVRVSVEEARLLV